MTIRYERPVSTCARLSRQMGRFALLLLVVVFVMHRAGLMETPYFIALGLLSAAFAALAVPLALIGLERLWTIGAVGGVSAARGLIYAALPLGLAVSGAIGYVAMPPVADVSSDPVDPPVWIDAPDADQMWLPRAAKASILKPAEAGPAAQGLIGRRYEGAIDRVYQAVRKVTAQERIAVVKIDGLENTETELAPLPAGTPSEEAAVPDAPLTIPVPKPRPLSSADDPVRDLINGARQSDVLVQGAMRTFVLGLPFDVAIRLREDAETTYVDIRVAARYGDRDLGMSAAIAESYLRALDAELLGTAGG